MDGREYHFVDHARFDEMVAKDEFLEWAEVHENCYGSPRAPILERLPAGGDVLFDIDWQGAKRIREAARCDTVQVFMLGGRVGATDGRLSGPGPLTSDRPRSLAIGGQE